MVKEARVNMLMHADHFSAVRSGICVFTDRIEFVNAGTFPIPPERMYGTLYSSARNPTIAKLFRFAKLSENVGFCISKPMSWKDLTGNNVTINSERDYVLVTLYLKADVVENVVENVAESVVENLTERQKRIISIIEDNNSVSATQISTKLSATMRTILRDLTKLKPLKLLKSVGPDKGGY